MKSRVLWYKLWPDEAPKLLVYSSDSDWPSELSEDEEYMAVYKVSSETALLRGWPHRRVYVSVKEASELVKQAGGKLVELNVRGRKLFIPAVQGYREENTHFTESVDRPTLRKLKGVKERDY